jgi:hypothetical protein
MLDASLLAEPSTPRPTFTPAARYFLIGAMPDPRRMFEHGQCAAPHLERFQLRPVDSMETHGWLGDDVWFAHAIHVDDDEIVRRQPALRMA